jgi:hypothetical protein
MKKSKSGRKAARRARSDADMVMHIAKPSMTGLTIAKLKSSNSKPINKDARLIVSKLKK